MHGLQVRHSHVPSQPFQLRLPHVLTNAEKYRRILENHLPPQAVDGVYNYLNLNKVHFHITRGRRSKLGDYRWPQPERDFTEQTVAKGQSHNYHEMSVNGDLNPYLFLWVFLHEAAHLETHLKYDKVQPHGHEWQEEYRQLIASHATLFPSDVQPLLARYVRRIPLNRSILRQIEALLHHYDPGYSNEEHLILDHLPAGSRFRLKARPDILFESLERRRTRWLCRDLATSRQYTIAATAEVITK